MIATTVSSHPSLRATIADQLRVVFFGWMSLLSASIVMAYWSSASGSVPELHDQWPREAWLTLGILSAAANVVQVVVPGISTHWRITEGAALSLSASLAMARILFVWSIPAEWSAKVTPLTLWIGPLVMIWIYMAAMKRQAR